MHHGTPNMRSAPPSPIRQAGGLTIFAAVVLLALMTLMVVYATRTSQSEQRISANDLRQKLAFQAAEVGTEQALEYLLANNLRILSADAQAQPNGSGGFRNGWFDPLDPRWAPCPPTPAGAAGAAAAC